ncbi:hypothetical protein C8Q79DRAFT_16906 [Trametes meyenii]|nr:hypothetical protein C8Q79DRAFT_16906 [Trametes meyenii]
MPRRRARTLIRARGCAAPWKLGPWSSGLGPWPGGAAGIARPFEPTISWLVGVGGWMSPRRSRELAHGLCGGVKGSRATVHGPGCGLCVDAADRVWVDGRCEAPASMRRDQLHGVPRWECAEEGRTRCCRVAFARRRCFGICQCRRLMWALGVCCSLGALRVSAIHTLWVWRGRGCAGSGRGRLGGHVASRRSCNVSGKK